MKLEIHKPSWQRKHDFVLVKDLRALLKGGKPPFETPMEARAGELNILTTREFACWYLGWKMRNKELLAELSDREVEHQAPLRSSVSKSGHHPLPKKEAGK